LPISIAKEHDGSHAGKTDEQADYMTVNRGIYSGFTAGEEEKGRGKKDVNCVATVEGGDGESGGIVRGIERRLSISYRRGGKKGGA